MKLNYHHQKKVFVVEVGDEQFIEKWIVSCALSFELEKNSLQAIGA